MSIYDPKVTAVADEPLLITPQDRAQAFWLPEPAAKTGTIRTDDDV